MPFLKLSKRCPKSPGTVELSRVLGECTGIFQSQFPCPCHQRAPLKMPLFKASRDTLLPDLPQLLSTTHNVSLTTWPADAPSFVLHSPALTHYSLFPRVDTVCTVTSRPALLLPLPYPGPPSSQLFLVKISSVPRLFLLLLLFFFLIKKNLILGMEPKSSCMLSTSHILRLCYTSSQHLSFLRLPHLRSHAQGWPRCSVSVEWVQS
jgi:hypothetical protein